MGVRESLKKGVIELLVLSVLSEEDMYGYQITQNVTERSGGLFRILEGSLYPILYRLSKEGYLSEHTEMVKRRVRVYYHLEEAGVAHFEECLRDYAVVNSGVEKVVGERLLAAYDKK